jgi:uncharacterized zinc-type alcohol dehydrogenase-like protein
MGASF